MFKKVFAIVMALCLFCGCSTAEETMEKDGYCFTDDLGRVVDVEEPKRVAALLGSYADMWYLAGGEICAAPEDAFEDFDLPLGKDTVNLGATKRMSLESLLAAEPDFVLASTNTAQHLEWQSALEGAGIDVAYFDVSGFEDYLRMLEICCNISGHSQRYEQYGSSLKQEISTILERNREKETPSVLVLRASASSIRAKNSSVAVLGEMLSSFDCTNIADSDESLLENLSMESILLADPEHIFIVQSGDDVEGTRANLENMFKENPLWHELSAVKNNKVHMMDKHLFNLKPNARWAEAYEILEEILYGESEK